MCYSDAGTHFMRDEQISTGLVNYSRTSSRADFADFIVMNVSFGEELKVDS